MGLLSHAEKELALLGGSEDPLRQRMNEHILNMVKLFAEEGYSGGSANYAIQVLTKLLKYEPLSPLTGEEWEWVEVAQEDGEPLYQNIRCSHVFRRGGKAYDIEGRVFVEKNGNCFTSRESHVPVVFPYTPEPIYVETI